MEIKAKHVYWTKIVVFIRGFRAHKFEYYVPVKVQHTSAYSSLVQYICPERKDYVTKKVINTELHEFPSMDTKPIPIAHDN